MDATIQRLHRLPLEAQRRDGVGAIMTRLDRGIQGFINAVSEIAFNVLPAIVYLALGIIVMLQLDWRMTVLVLAFTPLPAIIAALAAPRQTRRERILLDSWAKIYARFNEVLAGIATVRSFAMEDAEKKRFLKDVGKANNVVIGGVSFDTSVGALQNLTVAAARIAAIGYGGYLVLTGQITLGTLMAFLGYVSGLFGPVQGLTGIYTTVHNASVALDQVFSIIDAEENIKDSPNAIEAPPFKGEVEFREVRFAYGEHEPELLHGIDLHVKAGENIAIVGPSGSGKSTLMALLQRFYDVNSGAIRIDGHDIRDLKQNSLRQQIGVVMQDALLFNETVRDNIAYGRPDASFEEVVAAAKTANAHAFIERLEDGYDTVVGERGTRLSGGERQRIAIARALLKDPPILVLDEATSALDPELEAQVQDALERLIAGRTTFVVAHRLSTVVNADRIVVLKGGNIIECGRHEALLQEKGYYAWIVERQTRGLLLPQTPAANGQAELRRIGNKG
ncbi:ABC transporter ATP-binding protein [Alkalilimnicola ehrlichii]|uniref:ABC transporter ATP-binding protein n=1 Tax=Alkalilimnicola ehrlichii TaxID=351052 RepID=UPI001C6E6507|nr:ABC transporter ATP-binding protein [Alkalilimnicola ehrlichii]